MIYNLFKEIFKDNERILMNWGSFEVSTFCYKSGIQALRVKNSKGEIVILPFQGMQIWEAKFFGRSIKMNAMLKEPVQSLDYLTSFGAFFVHCGFTRMGVPGKKDSHILHGELHHAPMDSASLSVGEDERGKYIAVSGNYRYTIAFSYDCTETPAVKLYEDESKVVVSLNVQNHKNTPMEYMYMAHSNFCYIPNSKFIYSAIATKENVHVRTSIPDHMSASTENIEFANVLGENPEKHHVLEDGLPYDPEIVMDIDYLVDGDGFAHSMLVHPNNNAWYLKHRTDQFDHCIRWLCNTPDQQSIGLALPATAGVEGYYTENAKGNIKILAANSNAYFEVEAGMLLPDETKEIIKIIDEIIKKNYFFPV